ncbi:hypothetical protein ACTFIY_009543 [Dictyostelium cf. discoideum]
MDELINYCNDRHINGILTFYDFEKAFYSISHGSIIRTLQHIKVPINLINLIMKLLKESNARIEINEASKNNVKGLPLNSGDQREKFQSFTDDSATMVKDTDELDFALEHFETFCKATPSKLNLDKSVSIIIGNPNVSNLKIPISVIPERYLGYFFTGKGISRKMPEILNSISSSLTKTNILKSFWIALSKLTYYSYLESFKEDEINQINKLVEWFLSAPINRYSSGFQVINLMRTKRAQYPMSEGGWNIWNITQRQKHWDKIRIRRAIFTPSPTSIKNENHQPLSLAEWYEEIHKMDINIPKTEFQSTLNLRGYSYDHLFENILKIKDPKTKDTMFRFHARCLPLNHLHHKVCKLCEENLGKDPYGHLFFSCKKTLEFIQPHRLKNFIIRPIIPSNMKKDHEVNIDYANLRFHKEHFEWGYKSVNYDLSRTFSYRNIMALILHNVWNIKKAKDLKLTLSKDPKNFIDPNDFLKQTTTLRKLTCKMYCIQESVLPNLISFDQFI